MIAAVVTLSVVVLLLALVCAGLLTRVHHLDGLVAELAGRLDMETSVALSAADSRGRQNSIDWAPGSGIVVYLSDTCEACDQIVTAVTTDPYLVPDRLRGRLTFIVREMPSRHAEVLERHEIAVAAVADWPLLPWPSRVPHAAVHGEEGQYKYGHAVPRSSSLQAFLQRIDARIAAEQRHAAVEIDLTTSTYKSDTGRSAHA